MIDISQWRASIGLWACCQTSYTTHSKDAPNTERISRIDGVTIIRKIKDLTFALGVFLSLLLILSGDVELNPGPETGITSKLNTFPTRYELFQLLNDIRHKWYEIGLSLQISRNVLDDLKHSGGNDELLPVIDNFLITQPSPVSWETVITAVESSIVNDKKTGDLIRRYLTTFIPRILKEIPDDLFEQFQFNSDKWYEIGLSLQIHRNLLDDLKLSWKSDIAKIKEVIKIWENTKPSPISWETVMTAVESPVINNKEIAVRIRQMLIGRALYRVRYNPNYFGPTEISDSDTNKKLLDKAMKEGYVTVKWTKFSVSGAPGTGKSSFLNLLYNEDPPDCHTSTPVIMAKEARIISATVGDDSVWKKIDHETLKEIIAQGIKHSIRPHQPIESLEESVDHPTDRENFESSTTLRHQSSSFPEPTITQEIIELLPQTQKSEELYQSHWIYGVDTGGQAAFLDIAPALLRYHSVNILTHKLDEKLNDKAKFFFSIKGKQIGEPVEKQITNIQLLQSSFCSMLSVDFPYLPNIHIKHVQKPYYILLGTFLDKMLESSESLQTKNVELSTILEKFMEVTIMYRTAENEVIFPVNTTARNDYEINLAARIRKKICQYYIEAEIPIRWFLFQLELDQLHKFSKSSIVSLSKCLEIGMTLQLNSRDVHAALMYYHDLTIFLYFPKVLPKIVFLHPQPLFERLSDLISISFADAVDHLEEVGVSLYNPAAHGELKKEGTFREDLLTSPNSHLSQGFSPEFTAKDFLKLMESLYILASLPDKKYLLPSVLSIKQDTRSIKAQFSKDIDPLIFTWDEKPLPRGLFPALVAYLLHNKGLFNFKLPPSKDHPHYRNAMTLSFDDGYILLVDSITYMEVFYCGPFNKCHAIREEILIGVLSVIDKFHYMATIKIPVEHFYCQKCPNKTQPHFCRPDKDFEHIICCNSPFRAYIDKRQRHWFFADKSATKKGTSTSLDELLAQQPPILEIAMHARTAEWNHLGVILELDAVCLDGCHDYIRMYQLWIQEKAEEATRSNLLEALGAIGQNNVAYKYKEYVKSLTGEQTECTNQLGGTVIMQEDIHVGDSREKQKRLRLNISESDEDIPPTKQKSHILSTDSDLESYDTSSRCGKEPASGRPYKKKGHKRPNQMEELPLSKKNTTTTTSTTATITTTTTTREAGMFEQSETKDVQLEKSQLVKEQSAQQKEGEAGMFEQSETKDVQLEKSQLVKEQSAQQKEDLFNGMVIVGKNYSKLNAAKDQQLSVEECGLRILIPAQDIIHVNASYKITANGLWGGKFEFPENTQLISGVCYISCSFEFTKEVTIELEHCANVVDKKQAQYLSFVVCKSGPPFKFKYLRGGSFCPGSQYGSIRLKKFSLLAIVFCAALGCATLGLGGVVLGGAVGYHYSTSSKAPNCNYRAYIFYKVVNVGTWIMRFTVVQDTTYSNVILKLTSKHGNEEDNFPFRFANELFLSRQQVDTEESLKLLGFSDEAVHGWEITPLRTPPVINRKDADDFSQSWSLNSPSIPVQISANHRMSDFRNNLRYPITMEGIEVTDSQALAEDRPKIVITRSLTSNLLSNIVEGGVHASTLPDHFLDQQPTHEELISHARTAEWNQLGMKLGLDSVDLAGCHDCTSMYQLWIMEKAKGATRRSLLYALRDIRQNNIARIYEDHLRTMVGNNESVQSI